MEQVVLVDERDVQIGAEERWEAHRAPGRLHRAFSVMLLDPAGRVLLQRRADGKRTFPGRWSNTCCGHPAPGADVTAAARRRLEEEMGIDVELIPVGTFVYRAADPGSDLEEHELDHVLVGRFDGVPDPDPGEVSEWRWARPDRLAEEVEARPGEHSPWLRFVLETMAGMGRERLTPP